MLQILAVVFVTVVVQDLGLARMVVWTAAAAILGIFGILIAEDIIATVRAKGSLLTMDDFAAHESTWVKPISTDFMGHEVLEIPPSGQGLTALIAMNIVSQIGLKRHAPDSVARHHIEIEAMKIAWELRNRHIADPAFHEVPVDELLSAKTAQKLASLIDMNRALDIDTAMRNSDTIYLSVVDEKRLAVSFINSVYDGFGSCVVTPKTGIALQNSLVNLMTGEFASLVTKSAKSLPLGSCGIGKFASGR